MRSDYYCVKPKSAEYCINQKQWQGQHLTKTHLKRFPASIPPLLLPHSCPTSFDSDSRFGPKVDQKWDKSGTFSDQSAELLYCRLFKNSRICPNWGQSGPLWVQIWPPCLMVRSNYFCLLIHIILQYYTDTHSLHVLVQLPSSLCWTARPSVMCVYAKITNHVKFMLLSLNSTQPTRCSTMKYEV